MAITGRERGPQPAVRNDRRLSDFRPPQLRQPPTGGSGNLHPLLRLRCTTLNVVPIKDRPVQASRRIRQILEEFG